MSRALETNNDVFAVFLDPEDKSASACVDALTNIIETEYPGLEVVVQKDEEPSDPVIIDELVVCNDTFVDESLLRDRFIFLDDNEEPTQFCMHKVLDARDTDDAFTVVITYLLVNTDCGDDALDEYRYEIDYALEKEESYDELVEGILDYYGYNEATGVAGTNP